MITSISHVSLLINSYEDALKFYTENLGFVVVSDFPMPAMGENARWIEISPTKDNQTMITFILASSENMELVGNQGGGFPFINLFTDDIDKEIKSFEEKGVSIVIPLGSQPWGRDCMIQDLYGNLLYIVEPVKS